ncbi:hypothetical protein IPJ72_03975 [Candidatus Peregrinibacteria bacterium]|nr:MAG: hypothetical protein IPJ72_03975 [Candidatus Peregrinibacteria bacterium]
MSDTESVSSTSAHSCLLWLIGLSGFGMVFLFAVYSLLPDNNTPPMTIRAIITKKMLLPTAHLNRMGQKFASSSTMRKNRIPVFFMFILATI